MIDAIAAIVLIGSVAVLPAFAAIRACARKRLKPKLFAIVLLSSVLTVLILMVLRYIIAWVEYEALRHIQPETCVANRWLCSLVDFILGNDWWLIFLASASIVAGVLLVVVTLKPNVLSRSS
jgi:hypothetical protein